MRQLINYIRSCFCEHEWELILNEYTCGGTARCKVYRCKKCGYGKKYISN